MFDLFIKNGFVYLNGHFVKTNIGVLGEKIAYIGNDVYPAKQTYNAQQRRVLPGLIDPHVHFDLYCGTISSRDNFYYGSKSAAFGGVTTIVDFLDPSRNAEELEKTEPNTTYYADLMCLCYFLNWTIVENSSKAIYKRLLSVLDGITIRNLKAKPTGDLSYLYLGNEFFYKEKYVRHYYELFKDCNNYDAIKVMFSLIHRAGMVDEFVDYIGNLMNYNNGN